MGRREFFTIVIGTLLGGTVWLEAYRCRALRPRRERTVDESELMLPLHDVLHFERWARRVYTRPRPTAGEVCAERMWERYG